MELRKVMRAVMRAGAELVRFWREAITRGLPCAAVKGAGAVGHVLRPGGVEEGGVVDQGCEFEGVGVVDCCVTARLAEEGVVRQKESLTPE